jgi:hypothetical protein
MLCVTGQDERLELLDEQLRRSDAITRELISAVITTACPNFSALSAATKAKVSWLIEAGAWTDAALTLLEFELPQWAVRRLSHSGEGWKCSLGREPSLQDGHSEFAEAGHRLLMLAIFRALLRAKHAASGSIKPPPLAADNEGSREEPRPHTRL